MTNADNSLASLPAALIAQAERGNILSLYELYKNYSQGRYTDKNQQLADDYLALLLRKSRTLSLGVDKIQLHQFRHFEQLELIFDERLTVLIGDNGSGKTSIIEAVAFLLSWVFNRTISATGQGRQLQQDDIQARAVDYTQISGQFRLTPETHFDLSAVRMREGWPGRIRSELVASTEVGEILRLLAQKKPDVELPVFAFYSVKRAAADYPKSIAEHGIKARLQSRFNAYRDAFDASQGIHKWQEQYIELSNLAQSDDKCARHYQQKLHHLNAAIQHIVPYVQDMEVDRSSGAAQIKLTSFDNRIYFDQLSQGLKTLSAMVADLALRLLCLNSASARPFAAPGVVLIDEIELHLHPTLQQKILHNLQRTFPHIQFIVTTHSPQILTTVHKQSIRKISTVNGKTQIVIPTYQTQGVASADVLEQILDTYAVPEIEQAQWVEEYEALIQLGQWETRQAQQLLKKLDGHFGKQHPIMQQLNSLMRLSKLKRKIGNSDNE